MGIPYKIGLSIITIIMDKSSPKNWKDVRDLFRVWREDNCRDSEDIVELWESTLSAYFDKLGDEGWLVLEQVFVAALDCHNMEVANFCLSKLNQEFPDYLKFFMADQEAWMELSDLYINQQEWNKAAFCVEELILHSPFNHLYLQRYAEIKYTQGGYENLEMARSYYAQAVKLNPSNVRALYGLVLTSLHMSSSPKCPSQKKKESIKLGEWAANQLAQLQPQSENKLFSSQILEGLMGNLQITSDSKA